MAVMNMLCSTRAEGILGNLGLYVDVPDSMAFERLSRQVEQASPRHGRPGQSPGHAVESASKCKWRAAWYTQDIPMIISRVIVACIGQNRWYSRSINDRAGGVEVKGKERVTCDDDAATCLARSR